jgi:ribosomal protein S18 acetylase RimI-like enzyme
VAVDIVPVEFPRDTMKFVKCWWPIYAEDPQWVPPLLMDRKDFFNPAKNPYFKHADVQGFMAFKDGKAVGTIAATVDHRLQETEEGKDVGMFGFHEFIDDDEVAGKLLDAAAKWLTERGMTDMQGPFNFSPNHEFGLLIDGFDTPPMLLNPHSRDYFGPVMDRVDMHKRKDWYAYWIDYKPEPPAIVTKISERLLKRHPEITLRPANMASFDKEVDALYEIYNDAWSDNWGHVHMSEEEIVRVAKDLKQILDPNLVWMAEVNGEPVGVAVALWDYNQVAKKMNGRIFPFGWWHFLTGKGKIDTLRIYVLGIKKEYQHLPLGAPLYAKVWAEAAKRKPRGAECSLILEDNFRMRGAIEKLGGEIYKTPCPVCVSHSGDAVNGYAEAF